MAQIKWCLKALKEASNFLTANTGTYKRAQTYMYTHTITSTTHTHASRMRSHALTQEAEGATALYLIIWTGHHVRKHQPWWWWAALWSSSATAQSPMSASHVLPGVKIRREDYEEHQWFIGLARTIYIRCTYVIFGRDITKCTVIYDVYIRFWPTLVTCQTLLHVRNCKQSLTGERVLYSAFGGDKYNIVDPAVV